MQYEVLVLFDFTFFPFHVCLCVFINQWIKLGALSKDLAVWFMHGKGTIPNMWVVTGRLWAQPYSQGSWFKARPTSLMFSTEKPETVTLGEWNVKPPGQFKQGHSWKAARTGSLCTCLSCTWHPLGQIGRISAFSVYTIPHFSGGRLVTEECSLFLVSLEWKVITD